MLVGYPPFFSDDSSITCQKIIHWKKTFVIPPEANLSPSAIDLLKRLICDANERLGVNGAEEIKLHPFFAGVDWKRIRDKKSPYVPELKSEIDTSNFDQFEEEEPWYIEDSSKARKTRKNANFIGYTFKRDFEKRKYLVSALEQLESSKASQPRQKTQQQGTRPPIENLETQVVDNSNQASNYGGNGTQSTHYLQNLGQTSATNISSALSSITSGYSSAQPRTQQQQQQQQIASQPQLHNPPPSNAYGEAYYSSTNYSSAKSPKSTVASKQTFFKMPDPKERLDLKPKVGLGTESTGLKKFTSPNMTTSSSKLPASNMPTGSKGVTSGLYRGTKN